MKTFKVLERIGKEYLIEVKRTVPFLKGTLFNLLGIECEEVVERYRGRYLCWRKYPSGIKVDIETDFELWEYVKMKEIAEKWKKEEDDAKNR